MEDIFSKLGDIFSPKKEASAPQRIKDLKTLANCPEWPENPLKIFSLVERLRTQVKGSGIFAETIKIAIAEEKNYYKIVKYVQDKCNENPPLASEVVPVDLMNEIIAYQIPARLINQ